MNNLTVFETKIFLQVWELCSKDTLQVLSNSEMVVTSVFLVNG